MIGRYIRTILLQCGFELKRSRQTITDRELRSYYKMGQIPWSVGYEIAHDNLIKSTLDDCKLLAQFANNGHLPSGYGIAIDERCVELPWVLAKMQGLSGKILDAGSSLNYSFLVERVLTPGRKLHIITLAPEPQCFANLGVSYLFEDLRRIPIVDDFYDCVVCVSTLEHIGFDNTSFTHRKADCEHRPSDYLAAYREMLRILRPGGSLFITVPFGKYHDYGCFQQFGEREVAALVRSAGDVSKVNVRYFKVKESGEWDIAEAAECSMCESLHWVMGSVRERPRVCPVVSDRAASARAVACFEILK